MTLGHQVIGPALLVAAVVIVGAALEVSAWLRRRREKAEEQRCFDAEARALLDDPDGYRPLHPHPHVAPSPPPRPLALWSALRRRSGGGR